ARRQHHLAAFAGGARCVRADDSGRVELWRIAVGFPFCRTAGDRTGRCHSGGRSLYARDAVKMLRSTMTPARLCALCTLLLMWLAWCSLQNVTGYQPGLLLNLVGAAAGHGMTDILLLYSWLPRFVAALLGGAGLALAGVLMQQTLRNPLAAPTTLGVA